MKSRGATFHLYMVVKQQIIFGLSVFLFSYTYSVFKNFSVLIYFDIWKPCEEYIFTTEGYIMLETITNVNGFINGLVWGWPALILLGFVGV